MLVLNLFVAAAVALRVADAAQCDNYDQVNQFIATGGWGYGYGGINPGAQLPFSPLRLGPDTTDTVVDISYRHFSGYNYDDKIIRGFSHTHLVGGGVNDLGNFGVMPTTVDSSSLESVPHSKTPFWWSSFNKKAEKASPGTYSVHLTQPKVDVELLAVSSLAGLHKYTWHENNDAASPALVIDLCHAAKYDTGDKQSCMAASLTLDPSQTKFTGTLHFDGGLSHQIYMYVAGEIDTSAGDLAVDSWNTCTSFDKDTGVSTCAGNAGGSTVSSDSGTLYNVVKLKRNDNSRVGEKKQEVYVKMGISFISEAMASQNLATAFAASSDFAKLSFQTKQTWCKTLSELQVTAIPGVYPATNNNTETDTDLNAVLHSAHYRSFLSPTSYTETGGLYLGLDKQVHNVTAERLTTYGTAEGTWYSDFSLWDTFRTAHPWHLLRDESRAVDFARSLIEMTKQQNAFPRWPLASTESSCMIGEAGLAVVVEPLLAGMGDKLDVKSIYDILLGQWTTPWVVNGREDIDHYMSKGFVSQDVSGDATSVTLSFAYDDYLLGKVAEYLNDEANAQAAFVRGKNYATIWSPSSQLFCPKYTNDTMRCPSSGNAPWSWSVYREGDANHWAWFVPHDVEGLIGLYPSPQAYNENLEAFFANHVKNDEKFGNTAPNPYYWAGNEHDFLAPFMFNFANNCTRTQYWSRRVIPMHFSNTPHGIPGNEDYGSMSSWVLFASLGVYPQAGTSRFLVGAPSVAQASVTLHHAPNAKTGHAASSQLQIIAHNNSVENTYVERLLVNGIEYKTPFIERAVLAAPGGCKLEFFMTSTPISGLCQA